MKQVQVTVLMPVYNGEAFLREAIDSILNQTFTDFEFIIINDGSTDRSEEIIKSYTEPRIKYYRNESNLKLIATLNKGLWLAKGKYIVRMDADDISLPLRIEKQVEFMDAHPAVVACGSWAQSFGGENTLIKYKAEHEDIMFKMLYQCHFVHPTIIMRTKEVQAFTPKFDPDFAHAEDYDFFVRLGYRYQLANIQEVLVKYRIHTKSVSKEFSNVQKHNSDIVRQNQFKLLGCTVTPQLLHDFEALNHHAYTEVKSSSTEIKTFFESMIEANINSNYFANEFLKKKLSYLWFHYCYKTSTPSVFSSSKVLSTYSKPSPLQTIKWQVKRIKGT